jgi:phosphate transport system protein
MSHKPFGQELQDVKDEILLLSSMVEQAIMDSVSALKDQDLEQARQILARDRDINRKRLDHGPDRDPTADCP